MAANNGPIVLSIILAINIALVAIDGWGSLQIEAIALIGFWSSWVLFCYLGGNTFIQASSWAYRLKKPFKLILLGVVGYKVYFNAMSRAILAGWMCMRGLHGLDIFQNFSTRKVPVQLHHEVDNDKAMSSVAPPKVEATDGSVKEIHRPIIESINPIQSTAIPVDSSNDNNRKSVIFADRSSNGVNNSKSVNMHKPLPTTSTATSQQLNTAVKTSAKKAANDSVVYSSSKRKLVESDQNDFRRQAKKLLVFESSTIDDAIKSPQLRPNQSNLRVAEVSRPMLTQKTHKRRIDENMPTDFKDYLAFNPKKRNLVVEEDVLSVVVSKLRKKETVEVKPVEYQSIPTIATPTADTSTTIGFSTSAVSDNKSDKSSENLTAIPSDTSKLAQTPAFSFAPTNGTQPSSTKDESQKSTASIDFKPPLGKPPPSPRKMSESQVPFGIAFGQKPESRSNSPCLTPTLQNDVKSGISLSFGTDTATSTSTAPTSSSTASVLGFGVAATVSVTAPAATVAATPGNVAFGAVTTSASIAAPASGSFSFSATAPISSTSTATLSTPGNFAFGLVAPITSTSSTTTTPLPSLSTPGSFSLGAPASSALPAPAASISSTPGIFAFNATASSSSTAPAVTAPTASLPTPGGFAFGTSSSTTSTNFGAPAVPALTSITPPAPAAPSTSFFGAPAPVSTAAPGGFAFGANIPASSSIAPPAASLSTPSGFAFGAATPTISTPSKSVTFGSNTSVPAQSFAFGGAIGTSFLSSNSAGSTTATSIPSSVNSTSGFSFGSTATAAGNTASNSAPNSFAFGTSTNTSSTQLNSTAPSFSFGNNGNSAAFGGSNSAFGSIKPAVGGINPTPNTATFAFTNPTAAGATQNSAFSMGNPTPRKTPTRRKK